jgi:uncharacterized alpha-E superfamily protein
MLARVANSLYWMGRYLERTEHLSRYLRVQYFTSQDAPKSQTLDFVLSSIANMVGLLMEPHLFQQSQVQGAQEQNQALHWDEAAFLYEVALNPQQPLSILSCLASARENARSMRNAISTELWSVINSYYLLLRDYPVEQFKTSGLYDLSTRAEERCAVIRGYVDATLIHDETWALIRLGVHMERTIQIARILSCKLYDVFRLTQGEENPAVADYNYAITLKLLEAFDMNRRTYHTALNRNDMVEFLLQNELFPRSIAFNLKQVRYFLKIVSGKKLIEEGSPEQKIKELGAYLQQQKIAEMSNLDLQNLCDYILREVFASHSLIQQVYFQLKG